MIIADGRMIHGEDMKHALQAESSARQRAEARYADELRRRVAVEKIVQSQRPISTRTSHDPDTDEVEKVLRDVSVFSEAVPGPSSCGRISDGTRSESE